MKTTADILKDAPGITDSRYLAHIHDSRPPELLMEHVERVNSCLSRLVTVHGLDPVIDGLVRSIANKEEDALILKTMFVHTVVFHDFGKVNENYQVTCMNNGSCFQPVIQTAFEPAYGHSFLSAFLFLAYHIDRIAHSELLTRHAFFLGHSILRHHRPFLSTPDLTVFKGVVQSLKKYAWFNFNEELLFRLFAYDHEIEEEAFPTYALVKLNFSLLTAADYLATHAYMNDREVIDHGVFDRIPHLRTYDSDGDLNRLRQEIAVEFTQTIRRYFHKRLFYVEAPTGSGKSYLAFISIVELFSADPLLNKVFYVSPFTALITQTYHSLKEMLGLEEHEIVELHSKAGISQGDHIDHLFALYPVTMLSHVAFFDILKSCGKAANYLLHRLANSIVIIDEIQSYDPLVWDKMLYFIHQYATYFNVRFVLMSATLPKISTLNIGLQADFVDLLPNARTYTMHPVFADRVAFDLSLSPLSLIDLATTVLEKSNAYIAKNGCVKTLIAFIYKRSASEFKKLITSMDHLFDAVFVLSGTTLEPRRREIISAVENLPGNILLITTQVVEAGVDIDMDLGFKNISLVDLDAQFAGRVNRNGTKGTCDVYLFELDDARVLYGKDYRYRQNISLAERKRILAEKDFGSLYESVMRVIDKENSLAFKDNFSNYEWDIDRLRFWDVDRKFKIIDQVNACIYVPLKISAASFSALELDFLGRFGVMVGDGLIDGRAVWGVYPLLIGTWEVKTLQRIMAKFTFSLLAKSMPEGFGEERFGYVYLSEWEEVYSYEDGLDIGAVFV